MQNFKWMARAMIALVFIGGTAHAGLVVYSATDVGAGPGDPRPNSDAMAASFDAAAAALGYSSVIDFESAPLGSFTSLSVAPGVVLTGADQAGRDQTIQDIPGANPARGGGFNTTSGGAHYAKMIGGYLTFTFDTPTQFFGAYFTGVQPIFYNSVIFFDDGTFQIIDLTNPSRNLGGVTFLGFTDAGRDISGVTIYTGPFSGADYIGVDDVRFQVIPEPSSLALCGIAGVAGLAWARKCRDRVPAA